MTLYKQFAEAQAEFTTLPKDKEGYGYKYTDFDTVVKTIKPILAKHNLGFTQPLVTQDGKNAIKTILFDADGECLESVCYLPDIAMAKTNAAQNMGAAITYMKRYALCAILGISADEDIDGNADNTTTTAKQTQKPPAQKKEPQDGNKINMTKEQAGKIAKLFSDEVFNETEKESFRQELRVASTKGSADIDSFIQRVSDEHTKRVNTPQADIY
jgi:hypothetical protein